MVSTYLDTRDLIELVERRLSSVADLVNLCKKHDLVVHQTRIPFIATIQNNDGRILGLNVDTQIQGRIGYKESDALLAFSINTPYSRWTNLSLDEESMKTNSMLADHCLETLGKELDKIPFYCPQTTKILYPNKHRGIILDNNGMIKPGAWEKRREEINHYLANTFLTPENIRSIPDHSELTATLPIYLVQ